MTETVLSSQPTNVDGAAGRSAIFISHATAEGNWQHKLEHPVALGPMKRSARVIVSGLIQEPGGHVRGAGGL